MQTEEQRLKSSIETGNACKPDLSVGNKYYLLWDYNDNANAVLDFISKKVKELVKDKAPGSVSIPGIVFTLPMGVITRYDSYGGQFIMINKKRFKKHIKKAFHRSKV